MLLFIARMIINDILATAGSNLFHLRKSSTLAQCLQFQGGINFCGKSVLHLAFPISTVRSELLLFTDIFSYCKNICHYEIKKILSVLPY